MKKAFTLASTLVTLLTLTESQSESLIRKFFTDESNKNLLVVTLARDARGKEEIRKCQFVTEKNTLQEILEAVPYSDVQEVKTDEIIDIVDDCYEFAANRKRLENLYEEAERNQGNVRSQKINGRNQTTRRRQTTGSQTTRRRKTPGRNQTSNGRQATGKNQSTSSRQTTRKKQENGRNQTTGRNRTASTSETTVTNRTTVRHTTRPNGRNQTAATSRTSGKNQIITNQTATTTEIPDLTTQNSTTEGYSGLPVVFPGTKWCGAGQTATHIQDLGYYKDTDMCCRAHDHCNDTLAPGETRNNITNTSIFTKLHCRCDEEFYKCLETVSSVTSSTVGNMYFNILRWDCYAYDHPLGACKSYRTLLKITCKEYEKNTTAPKVWHWVPAKTYRKIILLGNLTINVN